ncbi:MAG: hypothetical protein COS95_06105, partial [Ignavibacteriales bacterium CG07_land_8_20_14_0_80_59_12]
MLYKAHLLKESFFRLWDYTYQACPSQAGLRAQVLSMTGRRELKWSRLKPYRRFVRMVEKHLDGILSPLRVRRFPWGTS